MAEESRDLSDTINGEALGFPGITGSIDCPFRVTKGVPLIGALQEASALLMSAWETVRRIAKETDNAELAGSAFLVNAADSLIVSVARGFEKHSLAKGDDGYHA